MERETENSKKRYALRRSILDYGVGLAIFAGGIFFLFSKQILGREYFEDPLIKYFTGVLFLVYGLFRMWRGKQQDYFREGE